ncbi:MAG: GIY-YIG nuclease family protein [Candidatus Moranbacteria bacterium]|nr:GIY-YIG nuclease family protein [Candidatus Moranbacteria bacterium]
MKGYVYILLSLKDGKNYIGSTDNLTRRITEHMKGLVPSTKNRLPVKLVFSEDCKILENARYQEKYYKSCAGRKKLKNILKEVL